MAELHKPGHPPPWEMERVTERLPNGVDRDSWIISRVDDEMGYIGELPSFLEEEARAIADLWGWIERAERFEEALREIAGSTDAIADLWQIAADALREEGRL